METCIDFQNIRSILNFANSDGRPFEKIQFRGGNEQHIGNLSMRLREFLRSKNYVDFENKPDPKYETQLRRITFYLILNTEATFKYDLNEDPTVVHILQNCPQLSKFLLIHCIWSLNLARFFYECITYTPHWFAWQFLEPTVDSLKDGDPFEVLVRIENLTTSIYLNVARTDYGCFGNVDKKIVLRKYLDHTMDLLRHFYTRDSEKFTRWSKRLQAKYLGFMLNHIMNAILRCFHYYQYMPCAKIEDKYELFRLMKDREPQLKTEIDAGYSEVTKEILHGINVALLNSLQTNVMMVSLDIYLEWAEIDVNEEYTLQRQVGEAAYALNQLLLTETKLFEHDVSKQLTTIATRPTTILELARSAGIGEIIKKLDSLDLDAGIRSVWLTEFIDRGVFVLDSLECLETIEGNIEYLSLKHVQTMITTLISMQQCGALTGTDSNNKFKSVLVAAVEKFKIPEIQQIIWYVINKTTNDNSAPSSIDDFVVEVPGYLAALTELFNKSGTALNTKQSYVLMFQNPVRFHCHLLTTATKSDQQQRDCLAFLAKIPNFISQRYCARSLGEIIRGVASMAESERRLVPQLIAKMPGQYFQPTRSFYQPFLYQLVFDALRNKDFDVIETILLALQLIVRTTDQTCLEVAPPLLFMCASLVDHYRWDITTYTDKRQNIVEIGIDILKVLQNRFLPNATVNDKQFIVTKCVSLKPMTRYYVQKFSLPDALAAPLRFAEFLFGENITDSSPDALMECILGTMARCTVKEFEWLARCPVLRPYWFKAVQMFCNVIGQSKYAVNATDNLRHTISCYVHAIKSIFLPTSETATEQMALLMDVLVLMQELGAHSIYDTLLMNVHYVAADIIDMLKLSESGDPKDETNEIHANDPKATISRAIEDLRDCEAKMLLQQKLIV